MVTGMIIGGGAVGLSIAGQVADLFDELYVLEKEARVGEHASGRSSQVIHAGIYYKPGSNKAKLCVPGNRQIGEFCDRFSIPYQRVGKLVVAVSEEEISALESLLEKAQENGVPDVKIIDADAVKLMEPNIRAVAALHVPTSGVFDTAQYVQTLKGIAGDKGVYVLTNTKVTAVSSTASGFKIWTGEEDPVNCDFLINAAGLYGDKIAQMVNPDSPYVVRAVRGEAAMFHPTRENIQVRMNVYPVPMEYTMPGGHTTYTTGVHFTPMGKAVTIGPLYGNPEDKEDYRMSNTMGAFHARVVGMMPTLQVSDVQPHQGGNSAKLEGTKDYVLKFDDVAPRCFHALGIDSPGLTASLPLGAYVRDAFRSQHGL